ncbi:MAG: RlmE family RNA methyltransferase [Pseudomonadota bacterium]
MSKPRRSSRNWRDRQERDPYVLQSRRDGFRSRAVYKLVEILDSAGWQPRRDLVAIDLGAAPGGWSQYIARRAGDAAQIVAVDLLPIEPMPGVTVIQGDFTEQSVLDEIRQTIDDRPVDLVMSDMAPNLSGMRSVDQPKAMYLAELALETAMEFLRPGGWFVCKVFHGEGFDAFVADARRRCKSVKMKKPKASRDSSRETYLLARN